MKCQESDCKSTRIASVSAKCSDLCSILLDGQSSDGYVPRDMAIGGGDNVEFEYCLDCGQIQDSFPLEETELELQGSDALDELDPDNTDEDE